MMNISGKINQGLDLKGTTGPLHLYPFTRRSNQSILKDINPEYSSEKLMLMLKLQYFGHMMRTDSFEKTLMLGKIEGRRKGDDRG